MHSLLDMCCTLLRSPAVTVKIGAYQQVSREMNPGRKVKGLNGAVGGPLLSIIGGPVCGLAFGAVMAACTVAAEFSDRKK